MRRLLFFYLLFLTLLSALCQAEEIRAMWVVRYALNSNSETQSIINTAESLKITDLYVQVRALGQKYGYSDENSNNEPLANLIRKAHKKNIRVHAWLNALFIWANDKPPLNEDHIYYQCQQSILRSRTSAEIPDYADYKKEGIEGFFIDPLSKENLLDLKMTILDLIDIYEVDGIHLDYFRYPSIKYSFSPTGETSFFLQNWFNPEGIYNFDMEANSTEWFKVQRERSELYQKFLRNNITSLLAEIHAYLIQFNKNTELSVAVKPNMTDAKSFYAQDWANWLRDEHCDKIVLMNYQTDISIFTNNLKLALKHEDKGKIIVGVSAYNQNFNAVTSRLKIIKKMNFSGYSIFSYNYLRENPEYLSQLVYVSRSFE